MKTIFQRWLALFVAIAFVITAALSWGVHTSMAKKNAIVILSLNLNDAVKRCEKLSDDAAFTRSMAQTISLTKARLAANLLEKHPEYIENDAAVAAFVKKLDVDILYIVGETGLVEVSYPDKKIVGYDMNSAKQSRAFLPAITNPDFELAQLPQPQGADKVFVQLSGVHRLDKDGIVQVGNNAEQIEELRRLSQPQTIAESFHIGKDGGLILEPLLGGSEDDIPSKRTIDGRRCLCLTRGFDRYCFTAYIPFDEIYASRATTLAWLLVANLILFGVVFWLVSLLLKLVVLKGVDSINYSLKKITEGDLNERVNVTNSPEFVSLSTSVNATVGALKDAIDREAKRIQAELDTAKNIQRSMLPTDFPNSEKFKLAASMSTAKEVGGDLYDFFPIDDKRYAAIIADVSGKGIAAGLFMTSSKMLFRKLIQSGMPLGQAVEEANRELCKGNETAMFLTAFFIVLDVETGEMTYVDAGHNPPLLKRASGKWEYTELEPSLILAIDPDQSYPSETIQLQSGDQVFLYTDGVTEALNPQKECFGEERLRDILNALDKDPEAIVQKVQEAVSFFADGAPQSDDVTQVVLRWH